MNDVERFALVLGEYLVVERDREFGRFKASRSNLDRGLHSGRSQGFGEAAEIVVALAKEFSQ